MSLDLAKVRLILRSHLSTISGLPGLVQYENRTFETPSPDGNDWLREYMQIQRERWAASNTKRHDGVYRIDVVVPSGAGTERMEGYSSSIITAYHPGLSITDSPETCTVQIFQSQRRQAGTDTRNRAWYSQTCLINWTVYTTFAQE